jgi:Uma2 family endonuclease
MTTITSLSQLDLNASYTYADYLTWKIDTFVELIRGKIYAMSPAPLDIHQRIINTFAGEFYQYFKLKNCEYRISPYDVRLGNTRLESNETTTTVVQPDVCVICDTTKIDTRGCKGAPDWIIEITSISTIKKDFNEKFNLYEENGVKEYWIVNPKFNSVLTFVLKDGKYESTGEFDEESDLINNSLFPDLVFKHKDIF